MPNTKSTKKYFMPDCSQNEFYDRVVEVINSRKIITDLHEIDESTISNRYTLNFFYKSKSTNGQQIDPLVHFFVFSEINFPEDPAVQTTGPPESIKKAISDLERATNAELSEFEKLITWKKK